MIRAGRRLFPLVLLLVALPQPAGAMPTDPPANAVWQGLSERLPAQSGSGAPVETAPDRFHAFALDQPLLRAQLDDAPMEDAQGARKAPSVVLIPAPDGTLQRFEAVESPVYTDGFSRRFPTIRTYAGRGLDDPTATARFDVTPLGFHASVMSDGGRWLVDPYYRGDRSTYVSYYRRDLPAPQAPLVEPEEAAEELAARVERAPVERAPGDPVVQRTYRLALANDFSYAQYFGSTDALVESAKVSLMNRVNQLYNDDLAIRMVLVPGNAKLNFQTEEEYTAAGYGSGACSGTLLTQNQTVIDREIGDANYDIGHIVKQLGGGGIAGLGVVGRTGQKARGCTGLNPPVGDGFAIDYVAHEMGHQYGGPHTFDGTNGNCAPPNRDLDGASAVEPGSGTSIQAYAGICTDDNLQPNSDPYFSQQSIDDIVGYVTSNRPNEEEEGTPTVTANRSPVVTAPPDKTIPIRTPFTLEGSATDADGDVPVFLWEQDDEGGPTGQPLRSDNKTDGPLFRVFSFRAVEDPLQSPAPGQNIATTADRIRTFPDPVQIAADNTNAESGTCGVGNVSLQGVDCWSEYLPTSTYVQGEMNFRLTARDRATVGGGIATDDVTLSLFGTQPFLVTAPQAAASVRTGGTAINVTWNVSQTNLPPIAVANVRISYSTDGGLTFPIEVLASTPNDGSEMVTLPNIATEGGRFKVEAIGNYFFDVSDGDLKVTTGPGATVTPTVTATATATATPTPSPTPVGSPTETPTRQPPELPTLTPTTTATTTATATGTATASPTPPYTAGGFLRPSLRPTGKRVRVAPDRKARLRVRCEAVGRPAASRCTGTVALFAKIDDGPRRRIGKRAVSVPRGKARTITVRINRRAFRRMTSAGRLRAKARVRANGRSDRRTVVLRPR
jgi:hypothetical protein